MRVTLAGGQLFTRADLVVDRAKSASSFSGMVVDTAGKPIADAEVQLADVGLLARSDATGAFRIDGILPGNHPVVVRKIGYGVLETKLDFSPGAPTTLRIVLTRITVLDSVVTSARPYRDPNMDEFEERRKIGRGHFVTRADLAKAEGLTTGSFLLQIPNVLIQTAAGGDYAIGRAARCDETIPPPRDVPGVLCVVYYLPSRAERNRGIPVACFSRVYVDNALLNPGTPTPPFNLRDIPPAQIEAIEVYPRSAEVPPKYANLNSGCGVVVIHTRRPK